MIMRESLPEKCKIKTLVTNFCNEGLSVSKIEVVRYHKNHAKYAVKQSRSEDSILVHIWLTMSATLIIRKVPYLV